MKLYIVEGKDSSQTECLGRTPKGIILVDTGEKQVPVPVNWAHSEEEVTRAS